MERQAARVECADIDHAQAFVTQITADLCKSIYTDQRKSVNLMLPLIPLAVMPVPPVPMRAQ